MLKFVSILGEIRGRSSRKTFGKSFTTKIEIGLIGVVSTLELLTRTKLSTQPLEYKIKQTLCTAELLLHSKNNSFRNSNLPTQVLKSTQA